MKKALVVGIDNYPNAPLQGCVNDAVAFSQLMQTHGDGAPNFDVRLETDVKTKAHLKQAIHELFNGQSDTALFYFSGHGHLSGLGGYVVTPDYQKYDEGISMDEILLMATQSGANDKIIILDCCHSGKFGTPAMSANNASQIVEGIVILTASRDTEASVEVNGHGIFTNLLLDALEGGAADLRGHITPGSVYAYIDQALGAWDQRPVFKTNVTKFTSLRTVPPAVSPDIIRKLTRYFPSPEHQFVLDPSFEYTNTDVAIQANIDIFKELQKLRSVALVVPNDEDHMYDAAQNSGSCRLTALGYHYWRLVKEKRI